MSYLITHNGYRIDIPHPQADQIYIGDIAVHLGRIPRFCGATISPFSVAQHSMLVCEIARLAGMSHIVQLAALLHDAHEAYFSDIPSPVKAAIKQRECGPNYGLHDVEHKLQEAVLSRFGVLHAFRSHFERIKHFDLVALDSERRALMHPNAMGPWACLEGIEPIKMPWEALGNFNNSWAKFSETYVGLAAVIEAQRAAVPVMQLPVAVPANDGHVPSFEC